MSKQPFRDATAIRAPVRGALWMVASAASLAAGVLAVKTLARGETLDTIVLYQCVLVSVLAVVPAAAMWTTLDASAVVPFDFWRLILAALIGSAVIFGAALTVVRAGSV